VISTIASLLHLPAVDDPQAARRMLADGRALVCEDDVKAVVVKLRAEYDNLRKHEQELTTKLGAITTERDDLLAELTRAVAVRGAA
jgi:hypothetical protein